jgi:ribose 5-phosphate isomerase B
MRIAIGADHRGLDTKSFIVNLVSEAGHSAEDFGSYTSDPVDYPDIASKVTKAVTGGSCGHGILVCDTGIGMSIAANKVSGIRAALCRDAFSAQRARRHNNANVLCLAAVDEPDCIAEIIKAYLSDQYEGGRHQRRLDKIAEIEG